MPDLHEKILAYIDIKHADYETNIYLKFSGLINPIESSICRTHS